MRKHNRGVLFLITCICLTGVAAFSSRAALSLRIGQSFTGTTELVTSFASPPDSCGVAGPNQFVEFINGRFAVYAKTNGAVLKSSTDLKFWQNGGLTFKPNWDVTDPRVIYDPATQRWFASQVDYDGSGVVNSNRFLLAVSQSNDPTGNWKAVAFWAIPGLNDFGDFPTLGLDADAVYLGADLFGVTGGSAGSTLVCIPKADLLKATPDISGRTSFGRLSGSQRGDIPQPAICVDGSATGKILAAGGLGFDFNTGDFVVDTTLIGFTVLNPTSAGQAKLSARTVIDVPGFSAPRNPTQPDGSDNLDDGDSRFSGGVHVVGGIVYAVHSLDIDGRAAIQWYRIDAATWTLLESGRITDPDLDLFYPSIAVNNQGVILIAYNGSSTNSFISSYARLGETTGNHTTFGPQTLLKAGTASYQEPGTDGTSRWGDYSITSVDPSDPTVFWTIQAVPFKSSAWSTQITQLQTVSANLEIAHTGSTITLSWPAAAGTQLQVSGNPGLAGSWTTFTPSVVTNGDLLVFQTTATNLAQFFRLPVSP